MINNKYELVKEDTINVDGHTLYRIRALRSFNNVKKGDLGGYIESEKNLLPYGYCWLYHDSKIYDNAQLIDNAKIFDNAIVHGSATISGNSAIRDNSEVYGDSIICDNAFIFSNAVVCGDTYINNNDIGKDAYITSTDDYISISPIGSEHDTLTVYKTKNGSLRYDRGCFNGTEKEFKEAIKKKHKDNKYAYAYYAAIEMAKRMLLFKRRGMIYNERKEV